MKKHRMMCMVVLMLAGLPSVASAQSSACETRDASAFDGQQTRCFKALCWGKDEGHIDAGFTVAGPGQFDACRRLRGWMKAKFGEYTYHRPAEVETIEINAQTVGADLSSTTTGVASTSVADAPQPVPLSSAQIGVSGTGAGTPILATLAVNPLSLLVDEDDLEAVAKRSRLSDISVTFPVRAAQSKDAETSDATDEIAFVGTRIRVNLLGQSNGAEVVEKVDELKETYEELRKEFFEASVDIETLVKEARSSDELQKCIVVLSDSSGVSDRRLAEACGLEGGASFVAGIKDIERKISKRSDAIIRAADKAFFGANLRGQFGDPTVVGGTGPVGTRLSADLAGGRFWPVGSRTSKAGEELKSTNPSWAGFRLIAGASYLDVDESDAQAWTMDTSFAFEFKRYINETSMRFATGLETRLLFDETEDEPEFGGMSNELDFRFAMTLPITRGTGVQVGLSVPMAGGESRTPSLTLASEFDLLFPDIEVPLASE